MKTSKFWIFILAVGVLAACQPESSPAPTAVSTENPAFLPSIIHVDNFGANPFDDLPDSYAIQQALDSSSSGDTIIFTSGVNTSGYKG